MRIGDLDVGEQLRTFSDEVGASAQKIPCRAHFARVEHTRRVCCLAQQHGDLLGVRCGRFWPYRVMAFM